MRTGTIALNLIQPFSIIIGLIQQRKEIFVSFQLSSNLCYRPCVYTINNSYQYQRKAIMGAGHNVNMGRQTYFLVLKCSFNAGAHVSCSLSPGTFSSTNRIKSQSLTKTRSKVQNHLFVFHAQQIENHCDLEHDMIWTPVFWVSNSPQGQVQVNTAKCRLLRLVKSILGR